MVGPNLTVQENIKKWVVQHLAVPQNILGGIPACPYASEALLKKHVSLSVADPLGFNVSVEKSLAQFPLQKFKMHLIVVENGHSVDTLLVQNFVKSMREKYFQEDLWLLYDHPAMSEGVSELSFNHGEYLLFMVQKLSDLVFASRELEKSGYYNAWDESYYREVVLLREQYFDKINTNRSENFSEALS
jgi:hypothetical protein